MGAQPEQLSREERRQMIAQALREYTTWGDAYIAEKLRADSLATALKAAESELERLRGKYDALAKASGKRRAESVTVERELERLRAGSLVARALTPAQHEKLRQMDEGR